MLRITYSIRSAKKPIGDVGRCSCDCDSDCDDGDWFLGTSRRKPGTPLSIAMVDTSAALHFAHGRSDLFASLHNPVSAQLR